MMIPCGFWGGLQETRTALLLKGLALGFIALSPRGAKNEKTSGVNQLLRFSLNKKTFLTTFKVRNENIQGFF